MPHFTLQSDSNGLIIAAAVFVSQERQTALKNAGEKIPDLIQIRALIDTGASSTCVDTTVLKGLQLTPTGSSPMVTPSTGNKPVDVDQYDIGILVPPAKPNQTPLMFGTVAVCSIDLIQSQGFHALIGRDILSHCLLSFNGASGLFTLAY
jgi:hypothetical protein